MNEIEMTERTENRIETTTRESVFLEKKPVYEVVKRLFDIVASLISLIVLSPVFLVIAAAIMIDDFGNPIFIQERIGKSGKPFKMLKWRTMYPYSDLRKVEFENKNEYRAVHFKMGNDSRITRVGKFLRRTSLDETLQFVNVLLNTMSLIGPRPFIASEQEQLPSDRLLVKPGISCYWQISDTVKMPIEEQLELDYKYIRERSVFTDIKIMIQTIGVVFGKRNC